MRADVLNDSRAGDVDVYAVNMPLPALPPAAAPMVRDLEHQACLKHPQALQGVTFWIGDVHTATASGGFSPVDDYLLVPRPLGHLERAIAGQGSALVYMFDRVLSPPEQSAFEASLSGVPTAGDPLESVWCEWWPPPR